MKRLVDRTMEGGYALPLHIHDTTKQLEAIINEWGKVEDLNEDMEIDILKVVQGCKSGIKVKTRHCGVVHCGNVLANFRDYCFMSYENEYIADFNDYGETWVLEGEDF